MDLVRFDIRAAIRSGIDMAKWTFSPDTPYDRKESFRRALKGSILLRWALLAAIWTDLFKEAFRNAVHRHVDKNDSHGRYGTKVVLCASLWMAKIIFSSEEAFCELRRLPVASYDPATYLQVLEGLEFAWEALEQLGLYKQFEDKVEEIYREAFSRMSLQLALKDFFFCSKFIGREGQIKTLLRMIRIPEVADKVMETFREAPSDKARFFWEVAFREVNGCDLSRLLDFAVLTGCANIALFVFSDTSLCNRFPKVSDYKLVLKSYIEAGGSRKRLLVRVKNHLKAIIEHSESLAEKAEIRRVLFAVRDLFGTRVALGLLRKVLDAGTVEEALRKLVQEYPGLLHKWEIDMLRKRGIYFEAEEVI